MKRLIVLILLLSAGFLQAEGSVRTEVADNGVISFKIAETVTMKVMLAFFSEGWTPCIQSNASESRRNEDGQTIVISGAILDPRSKSPSLYEVRYRIDAGTVVAEYSLTLGEGVMLQQGQQPYMQINLAEEAFKDQTIGLGNTSVKFPVNSKWSSGNKMVFPLLKHTATIEPAGGFSAWKANKGFYELRAPLQNNEGKFFTGKIVFTPEADAVSEAKDNLKEKLDAYSRLLACPQMRGFCSDYAWGIMQQAEENLKAQKRPEALGELASLEDWLGLRTEVYNSSATMEQAIIFDEVFDTNYASRLSDVYIALLGSLNRGDIANGVKLATEFSTLSQTCQQECQKEYGSNFLPLKQANKFGWIKAFELNGFIRHSEGTYTQEPLPWRIAYENGLHFSLITNPMGIGSYKGNATGVDFSGKSPKDFVFSRSWVTNRWHGEEERILFSVLTPLICIDDTVKLALSNLPSPVTKICLREDNKLVRKDINNGFDISAENLTTNWLILDGGYYYIGVIFGKKPVAFSASAKDCSMKFASKSFARLIQLPSSLKDQELLNEMGFWSRVALSVPVEAAERIENDMVTYHYLYETNTDDFGTQGLQIAPLPHMAVLGQASLEDAKQVSYPTSYGVFTYVEGDRLSYSIPQTLKPLRGINVPLNATQENLDHFSMMGADWVRLFIRNLLEPEETYALVDEFLARAQRAKIKVLIDPHDFIYSTKKWTDDFPDDPEGEKKFVQMWDRLSMIGAKYPQTVVGYDLYNELKIRN